MIVLKPIPNYPYYSIDKNGTIFSFRKKMYKALKGSMAKNGYLLVKVCNEKGVKRFPAHRLVAATWLQKPSNIVQINHLDGVKTNNKITNLEWVTAKQNIQHAFATGLMKNLQGSASHFSKLQENQVIEIKKELKNYKKGLFQILGKKYGVHASTINKIYKGQTWLCLSA